MDFVSKSWAVPTRRRTTTTTTTTGGRFSFTWFVFLVVVDQWQPHQQRWQNRFNHIQTHLWSSHGLTQTTVGRVTTTTTRHNGNDDFNENK
jgi:hypothetical protein